MGIRLGLVATLLAATGCSALPTVTQPSPQTPTAPTTYVDPTPGLRHLVRRFVRASLEYDSSVERRRDFLTMTQPLTTPAEQERLARSGRAHLNWPALTARRERTTVDVTGITRLPGSTDHLAVTTRITSRSDLGTVRQFALVHLWMHRRGDRWLVDGASGAGL